MKIVAAKKILKANDQLAEENRRRFTTTGVYAVNIVGSPGCGKTTLLEALFREDQARWSPVVIEGDIASQIDAERMEKVGVPAIQINTEGMCHLDANMVAAACQAMAFHPGNWLFIENVGNLVCTSGFDLGEHLRIALLSVPEGDDKVVKYPGIFQRSDALVITKIDLLDHFDFDVQRVTDDLKSLAPDAPVWQVSARTGEGISQLAEWLRQQRT